MNKKIVAALMTCTIALSSLGAVNVFAGSLYFVTGGPMGTYYAVGRTMANVLNPLLSDSRLTLESSGASKANLTMIEKGDAHLATVQNDVMYYAYTGTSLFEGEAPYQNFSAVAGLYDETVQIVTCDENIQSVADLAGKTVFVGDEGSGVEFNAKQILEVYGLSFDDINAVYGSFAWASVGLENGEIDAAFIVAGAPTTAIEELSLSYQIGLVQLDEEHIKALQGNYDFYTESVVPGGTYVGVDEDAVTVSVRATLVASNDLSEAAVYELLKAMFDNKDALAADNAKFESLNAEDAVKGMSVPFHAGAKKYYGEQGITVE